MGYSKQDIVQDARDLMEMYQAGFIDGYRESKAVNFKLGDARLLRLLSEPCKNRFDKRFNTAKVLASMEKTK